MGVSIGQGVGAHLLTHVNKGGRTGAGSVPLRFLERPIFRQRGRRSAWRPFLWGLSVVYYRNQIFHS